MKKLIMSDNLLVEQRRQVLKSLFLQEQGGSQQMLQEQNQAATVIDSYSDDLTALLPPLYAPMAPNKSGGRVRVGYFQVTLATFATGQDIALIALPKGARILAGLVVASATLANSGQISIGLMGKDGTGYVDDRTVSVPGIDGVAVTGPVSDNVAGLKAAAVQGTTQVGFALTGALGYLYETAKEVYLTMTTSVGTTSTEVVKGHVLYVVD